MVKYNRYNKPKNLFSIIFPIGAKSKNESCNFQIISTGLGLVAAVLFLTSAAFGAANTPVDLDVKGFEPLFPFVMEKGSPNNITNVQCWDKSWAPAGSNGFLKISGGDFVDRSGKRFFFGTNLCGSACFPTKEDAEKLADTFARCGVNIVRLHHMDNSSIWGKNIKRTKTEIDPDQLDRLDYLIAQLQKRGVFVNINLHVSRTLDEKDGFTEAGGTIKFTKGLDNFEPRMIELQKKYAKDLLTHVNPYTKRAYINDPGVAMIEINNENSVVSSWAWGALDKLSDPYSKQLQGLWNNWLRKKYKTTAELRKSWKERNEPLGPEILKNDVVADLGAFRKYWGTVGSEGKEFTVEFKKSERTQNGIITIKARQQGQDYWIPQFNLIGLQCKEGELYTFTFKARSKEKGTVKSGYRENHDPWRTIGFSDSFQFTPDWQEYKLTFLTTSNDSKTRITFDAFEIGKSYEMTDFSLKKGGHLGLDPQADLAAGTIPWLKRLDKNSLLAEGAPIADWSVFLKEIEEKYWLDMYRYVKNELKAQPPVSGTQLQYGFWYAQGKLDYCDIHAYWNHPSFPGRAWDQNDWIINKRSLVNYITDSSATLPRLASVRVIDRPLTVSEYDHPYPNLYNAEGNPMIAAFGAFQNWGAIYQFAWSHNNDYDRKQATVFFDVSGNQAKLAHFHASYAMFCRGDVQRGPGKFIYSVPLAEQQETDSSGSSLSGYHRDLRSLDLDPTLSIAVFAGLNLTDLSNKYEPKNVKKIASWSDLPKKFGSPEKKWIRNEFGEILWNFEKDQKGWFSVDTAGTKLFSGFIMGRSFDYCGLTFKPGKTRLDWTTMSLVKTDSVSEKNEKKFMPGRYLLTASGLIMNTGAKLVELPNGKQISMASAQGGSMGKAPVLCEGIPMDLILKGIAPEKVSSWSLDQNGVRNESIKPEKTDDGTKLSFGPRYKTLWYEINVEK